MITQARLIIGVIIALIVVCLIAFGPAIISKIGTQQKQIRVEQGNVEAAKQTGEAATKEADKNAGVKADIDKAVSAAKAEIDKAEPGHSNDAALRASCLLATYAQTPQCKRLRGETP